MTVGGPDDGVTAITRERTRQQTIGSVTHAQGAWHRPKELIDAALAYTVQAQDLLSAANGQGVGADSPDTYWPWDIKAFKRSDDEFRSLAKAGAFLAAAYDAALACRGGSGGIGPVPGRSRADPMAAILRCEKKKMTGPATGSTPTRRAAMMPTSGSWCWTRPSRTDRRGGPPAPPGSGARRQWLARNA